MIYKFQSRAAADVIMLKPNARTDIEERAFGVVGVYLADRNWPPTVIGHVRHAVAVRSKRRTRAAAGAELSRRDALDSGDSHGTMAPGRMDCSRVKSST